jgi:hypothetical protein
MDGSSAHLGLEKFLTGLRVEEVVGETVGVLYHDTGPVLAIADVVIVQPLKHVTLAI